jgi:hypothetical protein
MGWPWRIDELLAGGLGGKQQMEREKVNYNGGLKGEETDYTPPDEPSTFVLARESDDDDPGNQFFGILYLRSSNQRSVIRH